MKRKKESFEEYPELKACEEAAFALRKAILQNIEWLNDNVSSNFTSLSESRMIKLKSELENSTDIKEIYTKTNSICSGFLIAAESCFEHEFGKVKPILSFVESDLATLQVVNEANQLINKQLNTYKDQSLQVRQAVVEAEFNRMVTIPANKSILEKNLTIKSTEFWERCKNAWFSFWGVKTTSKTRFFQIEQNAQLKRFIKPTNYRLNHLVPQLKPAFKGISRSIK